MSSRHESLTQPEDGAQEVVEVCLSGLTHRQTDHRGERCTWRGLGRGSPDLSRISWLCGGSKLTRLPAEVNSQAQPQRQVWPRGRNPRIGGWACDGWECVSQQSWNSGRLREGSGAPLAVSWAKTEVRTHMPGYCFLLT